MKGKLLTSWSLVWLIAVVLFVIGGALSLSQRSFQKMPPTDGVVWSHKSDGVYAEKVTPGLAGSRAGISVGDRLLGISFDEKQTPDEIVSPSDVQMYLETVGVGGSLTYFYQKPSYSFANNFYYADLRKIDTLPRWTASIIFLSLVGVVWLAVGVFVLFKQGGHAPFVLHSRLSV
jgi:hypothetical protein